MADIAFTNVYTPPGSYSYTATDLQLDSASFDVKGPTDFSTFAGSDNDLVIVFNSTGAPITLTHTGYADAKTGRTPQTAQSQISIPAGDVRMLGPFRQDGWRNPADGLMRMQASAVGLRMALIRL